MAENSDEIKRREKAALEAIRQAYGTEVDEHGATLFVSHHLTEINSNYWETHLGTQTPEPIRVLDIIELRSHWGDDEDGGIEVFEFTLPGSITDYVISVCFDETGVVGEISMES